ncbi:O-antigen ligase family protein [Cytobacillus horneckiae]|uniref:O-antigen ligase family protein n=1 Tax=Cytobacillus horneckiae TaxID=549687 RepID=UPI003D9A4BB8
MKSLRNNFSDSYNQTYLTNQKIKKDKNLKVALTTYALVLFFCLTIVNGFQFGVGFSGVFPAILLFILFLIIEKKELHFTKKHFYILLFWVLAAISTLFSKEVIPERNIITFLFFVLFFIICTGINYSRRDITFILNSYIFIASVSSINIIWNFILENAYGWQRYSLEVFGIYRDPNYVSAFIIPAIGIVIYFILFQNNYSKYTKLFYYFSLLIMSLGMLSTGSRAAFILSVMVLMYNLISFLMNILKSKNIYRILIILFSLFVCGVLLKNHLPESIVIRLTSFSEYSEDIRVGLWEQALELFEKYPLFGAGMEAANKYLVSLGKHNSHNVFLDILIGQGLVGISLFLLIIKEFIFVKKTHIYFMTLMVLGSFGPLLFINGFNTASFWSPMILCGVLSTYFKKGEI